MPSIKVALLGFGTVGEGVYRILQEKREQIRAHTGYTIEVDAILVKDVAKKRKAASGVLVTDSIDEILARPGIEAVFEAIVGEEPAYTYVSQAIEAGCHVITANKTMFAKHGPALLKHAEFRDLTVGYEATVAGGVPIIRTIRNLLAGDRVRRIQGIVNGTSNFILTKMREDGIPFHGALKEAQALGYAEEDPADDVSGMDAFRKAMILSSLAFGRQPEWERVQAAGVDHISIEDIVEARESGLRYRHIADIWTDDDGKPHAEVGPVLLGPDHPLYSIDGVDNAIITETEYLGALTLVGPGAGMYPTGNAMVSDLLHAIRIKEGAAVLA